MLLQSSALLKLVICFAALCPTHASDINNNIIMPSEKVDALSKKFPFFHLPPELQFMIASYPGVYKSILEAYPEWKGFHDLELDGVIQNLKKGEFDMSSINDAGFFAMHLLSSVPLNPKSIDIMTIPPSSIFKLIRYLREQYNIEMEKFNKLLFHFAASPKFDQWFELCTQDERREFRESIINALFLVGKIDTVFNLFRFAKDLVIFGQQVPGVYKILYWAALKDDTNHFNEVKSILSTYKTLSYYEIIKSVIDAKAKNVLTAIFDADQRQLKDYELSNIIKAVVQTQNLNIVEKVKNMFSSKNVYFMINVLFEASSYQSNNVDILRAALQIMEYEYFNDEILESLFREVISFGSVAGFKMIYSWVHLNDEAKMDQLAIKLVPIALRNNNEFSLRLLLKKNGPGKYVNSFIDPNHVLDCLKAIRENSSRLYSLPVKYLLTKVDLGAGPELPIIGSDQFMENELLPLLIEMKNVSACKVALARNNLGELVFPFININHEIVELALKECLQCLIHFPVEIVNDYILLNPECYESTSEVFLVLTSATNGRPTFSAMEEHLNADYLIKLLSDPEKRDKLIQFYKYFYYQRLPFPKLQSMFTLIEFTPELNSIVTELLIPQHEQESDSLLLSTILGEMFLSKRDDGKPHCKSFKFIRNLLREEEFYFNGLCIKLLESYKGKLLYGLSIIYPNEEGQDVHLLAELPKIMGRSWDIQFIVRILLKTDRYGNFILNDISIKLVQNIAKNCGEEEEWYSDILLEELDRSLPPWIVLEKSISE